MIPPRISNNGRLPCRIESTKVFAVRNMEYYYIDINEKGLISIGQHKPDTGVCAVTISLKLLSREEYLDRAIDFLTEMNNFDKAFYNEVIKFYEVKFKKDLITLLGGFR